MRKQICTKYQFCISSDFCLVKTLWILFCARSEISVKRQTDGCIFSCEIRSFASGLGSLLKCKWEAALKRWRVSTLLRCTSLPASINSDLHHAAVWAARRQSLKLLALLCAQISASTHRGSPYVWFLNSIHILAMTVEHYLRSDVMFLWGLF